MTGHSWDTYYQSVADFPPRPLTVKLAARLADRPEKTAIDMGCGSGRDFSHLLENGFSVHAFDAEQRSIDLCRVRFGGHPRLTLRHCGFDGFDYPKADLVLAWASLYFCPADKFDLVWGRIQSALKPGGYFCGDFLGVRDSWVADECRAMASFTEEASRAFLQGLEIEMFHIRDEAGQTVAGREKHWHTFTVLARKPANQPD
ncbi:class I SAM-dependent methyltransferase [Aestuariispira insulae]|uniref:Methyltransferase family protein n=1 Tax=Aestuariispira insulae TaxID=1461337 RepID=A0A3D9HPU8_9PROT|nr:class I SAM-dependent methyltransferase [Aestuariispira insulae]RED51517.1 methyltransferase family protein [Aestuariispira insulae]